MSQSRKGGLGRGLAALIPTGPAEGPRLGEAAASVVIGGESSADRKRKADAKKSAGNAAAGVLPAIKPSVEAAPVAAPVDAQEAKQAAAEATGTAGEAGEAAALEVGAIYREIPPLEIEPNPKQPRQVFDDEALSELVHSIREFGLMQPIVVREIAPQKYQLVMGERRWRASQLAGIETIPAIVRETADDSLLRDALLENIHRVQLNPLEEAAAYQQLLQEFDVTHEELATRLGRSRPVISNMIRLLRLPVPVQRLVAAGELSAGHARALLSLEAGAAAQEQLAARIIAEGLSVRSTEEEVFLANREDGVEDSPTPRRKPIQMPGLQDVAEKLSDNFDTRVTVSLGKRKGKIVVEFGTVDDLERIIKLMDLQ